MGSSAPRRHSTFGRSVVARPLADVRSTNPSIASEKREPRPTTLGDIVDGRRSRSGSRHGPMSSLKSLRAVSPAASLLTRQGAAVAQSFAYNFRSLVLGAGCGFPAFCGPDRFTAGGARGRRDPETPAWFACWKAALHMIRSCAQSRWCPR